MKNRFVMMVLCALVVSGCAWKKKEAAKNGEATEVATSTSKNDLPFIPITLTDGTVVNVKDFKGKNMLVLFQPDCDHCQHEAQDMEKQLDAFKAYKIYFVSSVPMPEIEKFAGKYKLAGKANILFGSTQAENILNNYGPIPAPSIYIYNDQTLKQSFEGQTDVNLIISKL